MSDKFPSKEALLDELKHYIAYLKHLYEKGEQTHTLSDVAFNYLVRDMERIIHAVEHNLELDDRVPSEYKRKANQQFLTCFRL